MTESHDSGGKKYEHIQEYGNSDSEPTSLAAQKGIGTDQDFFEAVSSL